MTMILTSNILPMIQYTVVSKQQFVAFVAFGRIPIHSGMTFSSESENGDFEKKLKDSFAQLPAFQGDEEYLLVLSETVEESQISLDIREVLEVIPFSEKAYQGYTSKFDKNIKFSPPRFEHVYEHVVDKIEISDRWNGSKKLPYLLMEIKATKEDGVTQSDIEFAYAKRSGQSSVPKHDELYGYVLAYDRYEPFPNRDVGFLYDVGQAYGQSRGKQGFLGSGLHKHLSENNNLYVGKKLSAVLELIESREETKKFREQLTDEYGIKRYIASTLFFKFKDIIKNEGAIVGTKVEETVDYLVRQQKYLSELYQALTLTGAFFGFRYLRNDIYKLSRLSWYASERKEQKSYISRKPSKGTTLSGESNNSEIVIPDDQVGKPESKEVTIELDPAPSSERSAQETLFPLEVAKEVLTEDDMFKEIDDGLKEGSHKIKTDLLRDLKPILAKYDSSSGKMNTKKIIKALKEHFPKRIDEKDNFIVP
jgi:hypothetical protein